MYIHTFIYLMSNLLCNLFIGADGLVNSHQLYTTANLSETAIHYVNDLEVLILNHQSSAIY